MSLLLSAKWKPSHICTHKHLSLHFGFSRKEHKASFVCIIAIFLFKHDFYSGELLTRFLSIAYKHCSEAEKVVTEDLPVCEPQGMPLCYACSHKTSLDVCLGRCFRHFHSTPPYICTCMLTCTLNNCNSISDIFGREDIADKSQF